MILKNKKLLFFDPSVIEQNNGVTLRVCPPRDRQIVIEADKPWERSRYITLYCTVIDDNGTYKMYYTHNNDDEVNKTGLLYAESKDGIHWEKPELGLVSYKGSKANNMLGILANEGTVIFEPDAPEEERYKCFIDHLRKGTFVHTSPDGIHWKLSDKPLGDFLLDSHNVAFFDKNIGKYAMYMRGWPKSPHGLDKHMRTVVRYETDDINKPFEYDKSLSYVYRSDGLVTVSGGEFPTVFGTDLLDWPLTDVYTMVTTPYPAGEGYYVAFPAFYRHEDGVPIEGKEYNPRNDGRLEVMFAGSMDGINWHRYDRRPYVQNEITGRFKSNMVLMGHGILHMGDTLRQYGTIFRSKHAEVYKRVEAPDGDGKIVCYDQRIDGYVCAYFAPEGGRLVTCPWECEGDTLVVNADAGMCGHLKFGILTENGSVIPGFTTDDSNVVGENSTEIKINFKGGSLDRFAGKKIRVLVRGANAQLFSLKFENEERK